MTPHLDLKCPTAEELTKLLPAYEVLEMTYESPRDAIYRARQVSLDRIVTIKLLPEEVGHDPILREAFENDAKAMAKIKHPNLVDVFDFGIVDDMLFIITENIPGRSLFETTHGNYISQLEAIQLVIDICNGLTQAHNAGIIHRNLNPTNILINNDGEAKIVDFGIPALTDDESVEEYERHYRAPELIAGKTETETEAQADLYSLGVIFYELLVGTPPKPLHVPASRHKDVHPKIDAIIARAIQPKLGLRYFTAEEMVEDLDEVLKELTPKVVQQITPTRTTPPLAASNLRASTLPSASTNNNTGLIVILVIVAVVVVVIIALASQPSQKPSSSQKEQLAPTPNPTASSQPNTKPTPSKKPKKPRKLKPVDTVIPTPADKTDTPTPPIEPPVKDTEPKKPVPDPDPPVAPTPPDFDIDAYLAKARSFMQGKAKYSLAAYDKELLRNIDTFERDSKRAIRKLDRNIRKPLTLKSEEAFAVFRMEGRIPEEIDLTEDDLLKSLKPIHTVALYDQKKIDNKYTLDLAKSRITYIKGIDHKIAQLKKEKNDTAVAMLEEEIDLTQKDIARYIRILRGQQADLPPEEEEDEKDKKGKKKKKKKKKNDE